LCLFRAEGAAPIFSLGQRPRKKGNKNHDQALKARVNLGTAPRLIITSALLRRAFNACSKCVFIFWGVAPGFDNHIAPLALNR
jgi:hypothetical protein